MYGYFTPKTVTSVQKNIRVNSKSGLKKFYVKNKKNEQYKDKKCRKIIRIHKI